MVDVSFSLQLYQKNFDANLLFTDMDSPTYEIKSKDDAYEKLLTHALV